MLKRMLNLLDQAPMFWVAVGLGMLIFSINRVMPGLNWDAFPTEQSVLDQAFVQSLRSQQWQYQALPGLPQTYGAHVLSQFLRAAVTSVTGDSGRAGIWLSLVGITATFCGLYPLSQRIFPLRGFGVITLACAGALGAVHFSLSPDPSAALGMALVVWGMVFFLTAITKCKPYDIFLSGFLFGLAGYIRIEMSMMWAFLAVYLIALDLFQSAKEKGKASYFPMALCGLLTVLLVLWPMLHRNLQLSGSPILPGFDAEKVLRAPALGSSSGGESFGMRLMQGLKLLLLSFRGPGIFVGLLWPVGMCICLLMGRHKRLPYFWLPIMISMLVCLTALSYVTGFQSFRESLFILTPLILPFAILPAAYGIHAWMQEDLRPEGSCRNVWLIAGLIIVFMVQIPHFLRGGTSGSSDLDAGRIALIEEFSRLDDGDRARMLLSDMPGSFLTAGKTNVIGIKGETDWRILTAKYANGDFQPGKLLDYLERREIGMIHLANVDEPLVDMLALEDNAPTLRPVDGFSPPHRVFRVDWP